MLATNTYPRHSRPSGSFATTVNYYPRPKLPLRTQFKSKFASNLINIDVDRSDRFKRSKTRKFTSLQKAEMSKKKAIDYTDQAYREAVFKLKYLLSESYTPRSRMDYGEEGDNRSIVSDGSRSKSLLIGNLHSALSHNSFKSKSNQLSKVYSNLALVDRDASPHELLSFIKRQEDYIEQLECESQYCRDELSNMLKKVKEVVKENEALNGEKKINFLKYIVDNRESDDENQDPSNKAYSKSSDRLRSYKVSECPSIVFESRISELEAQLTQAKIELRKAQEENQLNLKKLDTVTPSKLENRDVKERHEYEYKMQELQRSLSLAKDREVEMSQKANRAASAMQQLEFEKNQMESEMRRMKDELDRHHEKLREATQDASRKILDERHQTERRFNQQIEQLSADVALHWDVASKTQLDAEKQRRELMDYKREIAQKQLQIDSLKKELQNKTSALQSDVNQAIVEKDAVEQELATVKMSLERNERLARQEQNRLQIEINSYKQRIERADADLVHCRRENLRLSEQISSLEKEIEMKKITREEMSNGQNKSDKDLASMILNMETKHVSTVAELEETLKNQAALVSNLTVECQSLTQRLEDNDLKHKEEMANLQSNIEYLSSKIQESFSNQQAMRIEEDPQRSNQNNTSQEQMAPQGDNTYQTQQQYEPSLQDRERYLSENQNYDNQNYAQYDYNMSEYQQQQPFAESEQYSNDGNYGNVQYEQQGYDTQQSQLYSTDESQQQLPSVTAESSDPNPKN